MPDHLPVVGGSSPQRTDRLDSWKEIAAYLGRDVTTVQRWEKKEGLPVHRKIHDKLGSVYAFKAELDAWWQPGPPTDVAARHGGSVTANPPPVSVGRAPNAAAVFTAWRVGAAIGLITLTVLVAGRSQWHRALPVAPIKSLAVMPLVNQSGDADQAYFVDGMHDALVLQLSKLPHLKVVSRRASRQTLPETARVLGVDAVLEGSVLQIGNTVRITLRVVDARSGGIVWAEAYERPLTDVLSLHAAVATDMASQINLQLMPAEAHQFATRPRVDPDAYRLALQAEFYASKRGDERFLRQAQSLFERAVEIDPQYAAAHAGLASALILQALWNGSLPPAAVYTAAKAQVDQALSLDPNSAEAYGVLGQIRFVFDWDWAGAQAAFEQGERLEGRSTSSRLVHANYLAAIGRFGEALAMSKEIVSLAPLVPTAQQEVAYDWFLQGRFADATPFFEEALRLEPTMLSSRWMLAFIDLRRGAVASAAERIAATRALVSDRLPAMRLGEIGHLLALAGQQDEARSVLELLRRRSEAEFVPRTAFGLVRIGIADYEQALDDLERGFDQRDPYLVWLKTLPLFDPIRRNPRFDRLVQRMHFPQ